MMFSRHKRELARTRQAFKFPRVTRRMKPSLEDRGQRPGRGQDSLDIWTVFTSKTEAGALGGAEDGLEMVTSVRGGVAWAGEEVRQRMASGGARERFRGQSLHITHVSRVTFVCVTIGLIGRCFVYVLCFPMNSDAKCFLGEPFLHLGLLWVCFACLHYLW